MYTIQEGGWENSRGDQIFLKVKIKFSGPFLNTTDFFLCGMELLQITKDKINKYTNFAILHTYKKGVRYFQEKTLTNIV